jgi:predicted nucleic acid-binding Zn finger protein
MTRIVSLILEGEFRLCITIVGSIVLKGKAILIEDCAHVHKYKCRANMILH